MPKITVDRSRPTKLEAYSGGMMSFTTALVISKAIWWRLVKKHQPPKPHDEYLPNDAFKRLERSVKTLEALAAVPTEKPEKPPKK